MREKYCWTGWSWSWWLEWCERKIMLDWSWSWLPNRVKVDLAFFPGTCIEFDTRRAHATFFTNSALSELKSHDVAAVPLKPFTMTRAIIIIVILVIAIITAAPRMA